MDGKLRRERAPVQRWRCGCGHVFAESRAFSEHAVLDHVSNLAMQVGSAGAAAQLDCDEKSVEKALSRWIELHCEDRPDLPDVLMLAGVTTAGRSRLIIADGDDGTLADVLEDRDDLSMWAAGHEGAPHLVLVEFDGLALTEAREIFPTATPALAVSAAAIAIRQVASKSFSAARSAAISRGTNARIDPEIFEKPWAERTEVDREGLSSWPSDLQSLLNARDMLLDALSLREGQERSALFKLAESNLAQIACGAGLLRFLGVWKDVIGAGLANRWADEPWQSLVSLKEAICKARPRAGGKVLRAILLIETPMTAALPTLSGGPTGFEPVSGRRTLDDATATIIDFMAAEAAAGVLDLCSAP